VVAKREKELEKAGEVSIKNLEARRRREAGEVSYKSECGRTLFRRCRNQC
jgi:hypothetical protein